MPNFFAEKLHKDITNHFININTVNRDITYFKIHMFFW